MKNKIVFAGFMGAILMSVGAANAATATIATKGYVDSRVSTVQSSVDTLETNAITADDVATTVDTKISGLNLDTTYEKSENKVDTVDTTLSPEEQALKYPSVKALVSYVPSLTEDDKQAIKDLTGTNGVITRVEGLETSVDTLTGDATVDGSVANSISDALTGYSTTAAADGKYQAKSTADYALGTAAGDWKALEDSEKAALTSGVTAEKVGKYDVLAGDASTPGSVAALQTAVDGLNGADGTVTQLQTIVGATATEGLRGDVADNTSNIATNTSDITALKTTVGDTTGGLVKDVAGNTAAIEANAAALANTIEKPAACESENSTCVLMTRGGVISWTPVTDPVDDGGVVPAE